MAANLARPKGLLDPTILSRIGSLDLIARKIVEGTMVGMHESRNYGVGSEFAQYRPYIPGDDLRALDWRVFARTDRYYVRQYTAETNLHGWLVVDASASMRFGSGEVSKLDVARMLAAAIAYLLARQGDRVGLQVLGPQVGLPPRGGERHLHVLLHALERLSPKGEGSVVRALDAGLDAFSRRGPIFVLSDLYEPATAIGDSVTRLSRAGFDVTLFHVLDPVERTLEIDRETEFVGLEGDGRLTADPRRLRRAYVRRLAEHVGTLARASAACGADFVSVDTSAPLDEALSRHLRSRRTRGAAQ
jgi:uncharacterized protein (DUF58 family)